MAAYIVATVQIEDPDRFALYARATAGLAEQHGAETVVKGLAEILEGDSMPGERVVVTRFPDKAAARGYIASSEYRQAQALRRGAGRVVMRLVEA